MTLSPALKLSTLEPTCTTVPVPSCDPVRGRPVGNMPLMTIESRITCSALFEWKLVFTDLYDTARPRPS